MCTKSGEFLVLVIKDIISYRKSVFDYIKRNVHFEPHKTRRQSHPPFAMYALGNPG